MEVNIRLGLTIDSFGCQPQIINMRESFLTNIEKSFVTKCIEERKVDSLYHCTFTR